MMQQPAPPTIIETCDVKPLRNATPTSLPLTFFDLFWLHFPPVERLFFYHFPHSTNSFFDSVLPNLKHSLSFTLQHFFPLAGQITWPCHSSIPIINYVPGHSVSFTVAQSNADFNYLSSDLCEASQRHHLTPHLTTSHEKASVFSLQVTLFPNSGFCIGLATHHAALDGKSSTLFMKAWAYSCSILQGEESSSLSSLTEDLTPFFDRSVVKDPTRITQAHVDRLLNKDGPDNQSVKVMEFVLTQTDAVKGVFELTPLQIQKLQKYAESKIEQKNNRLSTFAVTCAYVLACAVKAEQPEGDSVTFIFSVDCRSRLDPPIVPNYVGNCIDGQMFEAKIKNLLEKDGFISALEGMNEALNRVKDGVLKGTKDMASNMKKLPEGRMYSIAGSPWFEVYSIDFGWGRPKKVDITSIDRTGAFSLSESRNGNGGVEIGLVLKKHEMQAFSRSFVQQFESF